MREAPWEMERVEFDADHRVRSIHRIHPAQERRSTLRPAGLYLFQAEVLDYIPESGYFDLKEQLFAPLYQHGARTALWEIPGYSRTITSVGDFFSANLEVLNGQVPLPDPDAPDNPAPPRSAPRPGSLPRRWWGAGPRWALRPSFSAPRPSGPTARWSRARSSMSAWSWITPASARGPTSTAASSATGPSSAV